MNRKLLYLLALSATTGLPDAAIADDVVTLLVPISVHEATKEVAKVQVMCGLKEANDNSYVTDAKYRNDTAVPVDANGNVDTTVTVKVSAPTGTYASSDHYLCHLSGLTSGEGYVHWDWPVGNPHTKTDAERPKPGTPFKVVIQGSLH